MRPPRPPVRRGARPVTRHSMPSRRNRADGEEPSKPCSFMTNPSSRFPALIVPPTKHVGTGSARVDGWQRPCLTRTHSVPTESQGPCITIRDTDILLWECTCRARRFGFLVGTTGFEPAASASRTQRSTRLSHVPTGLLVTDLAGSVHPFESTTGCNA